MNLVVERTRPRGRPKLRWLDEINVDLKDISAQVADTQNRVTALPKPKRIASKQHKIQAVGACGTNAGRKKC